MRRDELDELHYITLIDNVPSILTKGILSHYLVERVQHRSIAMQEVQNRRSNKKVPGGRMLHEYVNTYLCARNPMLNSVSCASILPCWILMASLFPIETRLQMPALAQGKLGCL